MRRRLAIALATLVLAEIAAQGYYTVTTGDVLARRAALPIFEADPTRCYRLRPGLAYRHRTPEFAVTLYTNPEGMRTGPDRAPIGDKGKGVFRILFLGSSYAFGWGSEYEESYAARIGAGLARPGRRVEVVNLGTPGQTVAAQLCWLREHGRRVRPDLVVQTVFASPGVLVPECGTDLGCPAVEDGYLVRPSRLPRRLAEVGKRSALVFYGWYIRQRFARAARPAADMRADPVTPHAGMPPLEGPDVLRSRYEGFVRSVRDSVGGEVDVVFVLIPPAFAVHAEDAARWGPVGAQGDEFRSRARAAGVTLGARGLRFVDATPDLQAASRTGRMFYWLDTHLTPSGNRVVADLVLSRLSAGAAPSPSPQP